MKRFSRSDELVRHARLHARAADSAAFAAAMAASASTPSVVSHTYQPFSGGFTTGSVPPASGPMSLAYRRMSLSGATGAVPAAVMNVDALASSLSTSAPAAPSAFPQESQWEQATTTVSVPSHSSLGFGLGTSATDSNSAAGRRNGRLESSSYLPIDEIPLNDLSIASLSTSAGTSYQSYQRSRAQSSSTPQQHYYSSVISNPQQQQAVPSYPTYQTVIGSNYSGYSTAGYPAAPPLPPTTVSSASAAAAAVAAAAFTDHSRSLGEHLPRIPENAQVPAIGGQPISPLTSPASETTAGDDAAAWAQHLASVNRPRANSNVSLYSNASTACSNASGLSDDTVAAAVAAVRGASTGYDGDSPEGTSPNTYHPYGEAFRPAGRIYTCPVDSCGKVFGRSSHLSRHYKSSHSQALSFRCPVPTCARKFGRSDLLKNHMKLHSQGHMVSSAGASDMFTSSLVGNAPAEGFVLDFGHQPQQHYGQSGNSSSVYTSRHSQQQQQQPPVSQQTPPQGHLPPPLTISSNRMLVGSNTAPFVPSSASAPQCPTPMPTPLASPSPASLGMPYCPPSANPQSALSSPPITVASNTDSTLSVAIPWSQNSNAHSSAYPYTPASAHPQHHHYSSGQQHHQHQQQQQSQIVSATRPDGSARSLVLLQPSASGSSTLQYHTHRLPSSSDTVVPSQQPQQHAYHPVASGRPAGVDASKPQTFAYTPTTTSDYEVRATASAGDGCAKQHPFNLILSAVDVEDASLYPAGSPQAGQPSGSSTAGSSGSLLSEQIQRQQQQQQLAKYERVHGEQGYHVPLPPPSQHPSQHEQQYGQHQGHGSAAGYQQAPPVA
ncbi:hypothetical protein HDU96_004919 [Phlyctochytrium bullatum]|nr:hypothetical protein HDU96_004919 [Phlyctochytrium bullatum]